MAKYFSAEEFRRCTPSCSILNMNTEFLNTLDKVRELAHIPLVLNSAFRSVEYEKSKGRAGTSAHCQGKAVDIRCNTSANRLTIIRAALAAGIERIGVGKTYIHLDTATDKGHPAGIWHYYE